MSPRIAIAVVLILLSLLAAAVDTDPAPPAAGEYAAGRKAIEAKDWPAAIRWLRSAALNDPSNPDVHNLLGYAYRNEGQLELAFRHTTGRP